MKLAHIVAAAKNDVIGVNNDLPWDIPEDMKFFRETTKGHIMIMGRKTWDSVGHPLPKRLSIVVTRQKDFTAEGAIVTDSLDSALAIAKQQAHEWPGEIFIIGGGEIFRQSMDIVDTIYLTRIHKDFDGSIRYPEISLNEFNLVDQSDRNEPVPFSFLKYERKQ